jgi:sirohydrochlorin ferrochelatase
MVHGSPRPVANEEMYRVLDVIKERHVFDIVEAGFMECNEPTIPDAIDACIAQRAERVVAVPYFLHTGTHVADDLPTLLDQAQERHPQVQFAMGRYIGTSPTLTDILADRAARACP